MLNKISIDKYQSAVILFMVLIGTLNDNAVAGKKPALEMLSVERAIPSKTSDLPLASPTEMQIDEKGGIFVIDQKLSSILQFDSSGNTVRQIGRHGQGPGEFQMPHSFVYDAGKLFIVDQGNKRVQIMNASGEFISSFKMYRILDEIAYADDMIIGQQDFMPHELDKYRLLSVFDHEGRSIRSFGKPINDVVGISGLPPDASNVKIRIYKGKIFVIFRYYPVFQIYSLDGELLETHKLAVERLAPKNYSLRSILARPGIINMQYLFLAFDVNEGGLFACLFKDDIEILRFDFSGNCLNRYLYRNPGGERTYVLDIRVSKRQGGYRFHVLEYLPEPRIEVFTSI